MSQSCSYVLLTMNNKALRHACKICEKSQFSLDLLSFKNIVLRWNGKKMYLKVLSRLNFSLSNQNKVYFFLKMCTLICNDFCYSSDIVRRLQNLKKISTFFWNYLVTSKQSGIVFKFFRPSQNIWTLDV